MNTSSMTRRLARAFPQSLVLLLALVPAYLCVVAWWASASSDALLAALPVPAAVALTPAQQTMLLQVEDPSFYEHAGLSLAEGQGLSTITSSLARELYLSDTRLGGARGMLQSFYRAVFDCCKRIDLGRDVMALVLNAKLPKERQLALYVDRVYMGTDRGEQVRGLPRAAERYLGKPLHRLDDSEFIGLVAMIKAPNQFHPLRAKASHARRSARIEALLAGKCRPEGWLDTTYDACGP